jgi:DNA mismatch repair protein MutH
MYNSMTSPPVHSRVKTTMVSSADNNEMGLQQFAKVLTSLGYNEMASAATLPLPVDLLSIAGWTELSHP